MAMNDAVDWRRELGAGVPVGLIHAGRSRSDAGTLFGPVPWALCRGLARVGLGGEGAGRVVGRGAAALLSWGVGRSAGRR